MTVLKGIIKTAKTHGWSEIQSKDPTMISFGKVFQGSPARINVWFTTMTVGTYLNHPKQGKTQLFRKWCSEEQIGAILKNPRVHTEKGYR